MEEPRPCSLEAFWQKLQSASHKILILDYDGTLAPFRQERDKALPYPGTKELLDKIQRSGKTRLIIVSGRNIQDVIALLDLEELPEIWGGHGFERQEPGSSLQRKKISEACALDLQKAFLWLKENGYEDFCEQKPSSIAFHWRGQNKENQKKFEKELRRAWEPLTQKEELEIHPFDGGLELRCTGMHKGDAIRQILHESKKDAVIAYLGDDLTDEDAFRALKESGLSVLVRDSSRKTLADCWLRPPEGLLDFLQNWLKFSTKT